MAKTLYILVDIHNLLQVLIVSVVKDGVVYDDAIHIRVDVGGKDCFFDIVAGDLTEGIAESTVNKE